MGVVLIAAPPALAGTATVSAGVLSYVADAGESNRVQVSDIFGPGSSYQVVDTAGVTASDSCTQTSTTEARCQRTGVLSIAIDVGDADDTVQISSVSSIPALLQGGTGDDHLIGLFGNDVLSGGDGADDLEGAQGGDTLNGGPGDDTLEGVLGNDTLRGDGGDDVLRAALGTDAVDGGDGRDRADYAGYTSSVNLTLDGVANDGASGENDDLIAIEDLTGGDASDNLTGDGVANRLDAGDGDDHLTGAGGLDVYLAGAGDDVLAARDGLGESIDCGSGASDAATADVTDQPSGCETVTLPPPPDGDSDGVADT